MKIETENFTGADCTGSSGDSNRVLTLANSVTTSADGFSVSAAGLTLSITSEYTVEHKEASTEITFLNPLWDDSNIVVSYTIEASAGGVTGVGDDFSLGPLSDFGVTGTRTPVTKTTDFSGNKVLTDGVDEDIQMVMSPYKEKYNLDKSGLGKVYDAMIFIAATVTLNKHDKITHDSKVYRVDSVSTRDFNGTTLFKLAMLFYVQDE